MREKVEKPPREKRGRLISKSRSRPISASAVNATSAQFVAAYATSPQAGEESFRQTVGLTLDHVRNSYKPASGKRVISTHRECTSSASDVIYKLKRATTAIQPDQICSAPHGHPGVSSSNEPPQPFSLYVIRFFPRTLNKRYKLKRATTPIQPVALLA